MSEDQIKKWIAENVAANEMIDSETGLKTVEAVVQIADAEQVE